MHSLENTLTKACMIIDEAGSQPSPEITAIRCLLITPEHIRTLGKDGLFLALTKKLVRERFNLSFPEDPASYDQYILDCSRLANQLEKEPKPFVLEEWLNYAYLLFENIKTPYYDIYAEAISTLRACFHDSGRANQAMADVYAFLIKAGPDRLDLIRTIVRHAPVYCAYPAMDDGLLSGILKDSLALFGQDKNYWATSATMTLYGIPTRSLKEIHLGRLLEDWLNKEELFLQETFSERDRTGLPLSLPSYLAKRTLWMADHREKSAEAARDIIFSLNRTGTGLAPVGDFLSKYAYNMNAASYITDPAIGRDREIRDLELILISPKKSPVIIGDAGVGKTALVEGLAYRLAKGKVPDLLKDRILYKLTTTSLLGGAKYVGEMEERIRALTEELRNHPEIILFIDEIHTIVGAGSTENSNNDISNMIKPFIDRGDIKIIGATTIDEYERFLVPDRALARRFYPILVEEPDQDLCLQILLESIPSIEYQTRVRNNYSPAQTRELLGQLIRLCTPDRQPADQITKLPELPLSILEMAFSFAALRNSSSFEAVDLSQAIYHSSRLTREAREAAKGLAIWDSFS